MAMDAVDAARQAFCAACALDVAVRKPGNVSLASPGHGMQAALFIASAQAAAAPLCARGASVGERIEGAITATWAAVDCNTNLGIVLLCAPIAHAAQRLQPAPTREALRAAIGASLAGLSIDDASAAFRAIARARPAGLGRVSSQDVHTPATVNLRAAMALAAERDRIARLYRDGFDVLFDVPWPHGFSPSSFDMQSTPSPATVADVQRLYTTLLASWPDSHIVRKHGEAVAQNVMTAAQAWLAREPAAVRSLDSDPAYAAWDEALKSQGVNPGTTADLTVATLMLAGVVAGPATDGTERDNRGSTLTTRPAW